jgi:NTE family protein
VEWEFFTYLKDVGRQAADRWLTQNYELLGIRSSVDVARTYL